MENNPIYKPSGTASDPLPAWDVVVNPLYQGAGTEGTSSSSESEVISNPLYQGASASGYNPLHRP
jgi:hypothetical protein